MIGRRVTVPHTVYLPTTGRRIQAGRGGLVVAQAEVLGWSSVSVVLDAVEANGVLVSETVTMPVALVNLDDGDADEVVWTND